MKFRFKNALVFVLCISLVCSLFFGCASKKNESPVAEIKTESETTTQTATNNETGPKTGGVLKIALDAEPKGLDMMLTTATLTWTIAWHMFENLFSLGEHQEIIPMLAKDYSISEDRLTYNIDLRGGVKFHNGKEMTAEDVVASLNRWGKVASAGKKAFKNVEKLEVTGELQIQIKLNNPDSGLLTALAIPNQGAIIIPKEIAETAGQEPLNEFIGTGPFKFVDWKPNQYLRLQKFEDYCALEGEANGYGGKKVAYVDELYYTPVPDVTVQSAGVETGDFDYAYAVSSDEYERLKETEGVQVIVSEPRAFLAFIMNTKEGIMADVRVRQAFMAALNMEPILEISRGHKDFWRMNPSLMQKETIWASDVGKELYNQSDPEKAKELLKASSYNGETIRWISSYEGYYNAALVAKKQLEEVGFIIDLQKYEPSAEKGIRKDSSKWDVAVTGYTKRPDPTLNSFMNSSNPGWWNNEEVQMLLNKMTQETNFDERFKMWEKIQLIFYEEVPYIKVGDYATLRVLSKDVKNFQSYADIFFWNVWLDREE